jgi:DNA polymerase/3'-5' exonuclease PolX
MDYKPVIIEALTVLRKRDLAEKQPFKARAYQTVITQLQQFDGPITSFEQLQHFKGLGDAIKKKIQEIMATGQLQSAERAKEQYPIEAMSAFQNIYGVGPAKARELTDKGLRSIGDLMAAVKRIPSLLNDKQRVGLTYYEPLLERIPRGEMDEHKDILEHYLPFHGEIVGSYRRGAPSSGDIDVLLRMPHGMLPAQAKQQLAQIVQHLTEAKYIVEVLALGEHKCMAICKRDETSTPRRLDLLMVPEEQYAYGLLYFTGSDRFNVAFRQHCLQMGYTLNEKALTPLEDKQVKPVEPMATEKDIFTFLSLQYVAPQDRVDEKQIRRVIKRPTFPPTK